MNQVHIDTMPGGRISGKSLFCIRVYLVPEFCMSSCAARFQNSEVRSQEAESLNYETREWRENKKIAGYGRGIGGGEFNVPLIIYPYNRMARCRRRSLCGALQPSD